MYKYLKKRRLIIHGLITTLIISVSVTTALAKSTHDDHNAELDGARIFVERCVLCHGNYGAGDGFMSLVISDYPDTSLLMSKKSGHFKEIQKQVKWGGAKGKMNTKSPPWDKELNLSEIKAVSQFIITLQDTPEQARRSLDAYLANEPVSLETGRLVYKTRCESCHGSSGSGDGPMSVVVKNPSPSNLILSRLPELELGKIISHGGEKVGRSGQMPAWETELTQVQIDSVAEYVRQFRN